MKPVIMIPSRLASTRFPRKPLAQVAGLPMIVHCWQRACEADTGPVVVAAGDREIADSIQDAGGIAIMTEPELPSGSDRIWQALQIFDPEGSHDVIINMQGDLPSLDAVILQECANILARERTCDIGTIAAVIDTPQDVANPDIVKVFVSLDRDNPVQRALAFSRSPVPHGDGPHFHHIGVYSYRREALRRFVGAPPSRLEKREKLEQLRALELGMRIDVALVDTIPVGVDAPGDVIKAEAVMAREQP